MKEGKSVQRAKKVCENLRPCIKNSLWHLLVYLFLVAIVAFM